MADPCIEKAFNDLGVDITQGMKTEEAKAITDEIAGIIEAAGDPDNMSNEMKQLLNNTIRGTIADKVDAAIKERQLFLEIMRDAPSEKQAAERLNQILLGERASVLKMAEADRMLLAKEFDRHLDDSARKLWDSTQKVSGGKEVNEIVTKGLFELQHGGDLKKTDIPSAYHSDIEKIYKGITEMQKKNYYQQKTVGIRMGKLDNYMMKQRWDAESVSNFGKKEFVSWLEANTDHKKVFQGDAFTAKTDLANKSRMQIWEEVYENIVNPQRSGLGIQNADPVAAALKGKSNRRALFFKDGNAAFQAFKDFSGNANMKAVLDSEMVNTAQLTSVRRTLGASPKTTVANVLDRMMSNYPASKARTKMKSSIEGTTKILLDRPTYDQGVLAHMAKGLSAVQMLKLASTTIRQTPADIVATTRTIMVAQGNVEAFSAMAKAVQLWGRNFTQMVSGEDVNKAMGLFFDQGMGSAMSRMDSAYAPRVEQTAQASSLLQQGASSFLRSTGLNFATDVNRSVIANQIGTTIDDAISSAFKGFKGEPDRVRKAFTHLLVEEGRLRSDEIDFLGKHLKDIRGTADGTYMKDQFNPDKILHIADEKIRPRLPELNAQLSKLDPKSDEAVKLKRLIGAETGAAKRYKDKVHRKVKGLMIGKIDSGVPVPNPRYSVKRVIKQGDNISGAQQMVGVLGMFKDTILSLTFKSMEQAQVHYANVGATGAATSAATLAVGSTAFYMAADLVSSAIMNKEPIINKYMREDYEGVAEDLANRLSLVPFFSDPILRMTMANDSPFSKGVVSETLMGPAGGMVEDFLKSFSRKDTTGHMAKMAARHLNPLNHWAIDSGARWMGKDMRNLGKKPKNTFRLDGR